jgi:hypothetical protein
MSCFARLFLLSVLAVGIGNTYGQRRDQIVRQEIEAILREHYHDNSITVSRIIADIKKGQSEKGHELPSKGPELALDVSPCEAQKTVLLFAPPFHKEEISPVTCQDRQISRVLVTKD